MDDEVRDRIIPGCLIGTAAASCLDDEVRDRIMPGCLIGTAAASCFFDLVDGERGSRRYQYNSKQNEFGYFYESWQDRWVVFDNRMGALFVTTCKTVDEATDYLIDRWRRTFRPLNGKSIT